ncbi:MAG: DNA-binding transcriptional regulator Fis [Luminiphilus sp.]|nr:DNA-binding transcriptional regulator Fis [Luminiphilus sp.]
MNTPKKAAPATRRSSKKTGPPPLRDSAAEAIAHFLDTLDGEPCSGIYDMVLHQIEEPLLKAVLEYNNQNQSQAASMLGLNRGTLRKKLRQYGLVSESEPLKRKKRSRSGSAAASTKTSEKRKR